MHKLLGHANLKVYESQIVQIVNSMWGVKNL